MKTESREPGSEDRGRESAAGMRAGVLEYGNASPFRGLLRSGLEVRAGCPQPAAARWGHRALPWIATPLLACSPCASAQEYSIDWHTIDGGGGTSTGGVYSVSGTIGQPDAGVMSGGAFTLTGGFWALPVAVQETNAPALFIAPAATGFATISWDPPTQGFILQASPTLTPPAWTNVPSGALNPVTVPATLPTSFYRLHKP